jgi:hypothetical protein
MQCGLIFVDDQINDFPAEWPVSEHPAFEEDQPISLVVQTGNWVSQGDQRKSVVQLEPENLKECGQIQRARTVHQQCGISAYESASKGQAFRTRAIWFPLFGPHNRGNKLRLLRVCTPTL